LREGRARLQPEAALQLRLAPRQALTVRPGRVAAAGDLDGGAGDVRALAGRDADGDGARRGVAARAGAGRGVVVQGDGDLRAEVAQRGQQGTHVGLGGPQQAAQLGILQVGQVAKALQLHVARQVFAHLGVIGLHLQREGVGAAALGGVGGDGALALVGRLLRVAAAQQAAARQRAARQQQRKQQRRPSGRRALGGRGGEGAWFRRHCALF